jgi:uncharacterized membrane protein YuzA (DUF378 family)
MVAYMIVGLVSVIAFLCFSQVIPEMTHRHPAPTSSPKRHPARESKK